MREWRKLAYENGLPEGIPITPNKVYKNKGWKDSDDFLGTERIRKKVTKPLPFLQAREYARSLRLNSHVDWNNYSNLLSILFYLFTSNTFFCL
jgi:hypothetical protein